MASTPQNRRVNPGMVFLTGVAMGVVSYLVAEALTPQNVPNAGDHDILLATRLGFIFTPMVALWLAWLQHSWRRAIAGAVVGIAIGFVYMWMCSSRDFLAIMVGFPCLLGGGMAAILGSNRSPWLAGFALRLGKGLLAGFVLGLVYMVALNLTLEMVMGHPHEREDFTRLYVASMWRAGPIALGLASGFFAVSIRWAVGLTKVRLIVFEDAEQRPAGTHGAQPPSNTERGDGRV